MQDLIRLSTLATTTDIATIVAVMLAVVSFIVSFYIACHTIDEKIDARIDDRTKPFVDLLQDTVKAVKSLEKNTAEMNATLSILKDLLITFKKS